MKKKVGSALVVGSGIAGIRSALDLAEQGYQVTLIDKAPHLGGILTQLDYQFPTDRCGMCKMLPLVDRDSSSQYCLRKGLFHENITLRLATELVGLEGEPGKFQATLRQIPTMVDPELCIGCGECSRVCPVEVPDQFNAGLTKRKAVYLPIPHNIPNTYVVDMATCTLCGECEKICPTGAIDFGVSARGDFKVLVVDRDASVGEALKELLGKEGFQVETVDSGAQVLEMMTAREWNLMLLDTELPDMAGLDLLKRAKELRPQLGVVMMGDALGPGYSEAVSSGALDYLVKPIDQDRLVPLMVRFQLEVLGAGERQLEVGAVIFTSGFDFYDPAAGRNTYRYGELPNVVTSIEFERILSGTGPTNGRLRRPSDGKEIKKIAWLQCVGSRDPQEDADFCSSICCMFAIKEALLAKEKGGSDVDTTIFYMDMRAFGKDFHRYRVGAEEDHGVKFVRSRIHSIEPAGPEGDLVLAYLDADGRKRQEVFDMVVLSVGQRPPAGSEALADMTGVEQNQWGFWLPMGFPGVETTREGVFIGGSFSGARDISESVIQAGAASLEASRLIHSKGGGLALEPGPETSFRDVSRELPRVSVLLCSCGDDLSKALDMERLKDFTQEQGSVVNVAVIERACTREGWQEALEAINASGANRVLIAACMPYVYGKKLRDLGEAIGLSPSLMEVVDIRTPAFGHENMAPEEVLHTVGSVIAMGISRVKGMDPVPVPTVRVEQKALVVGGGISGMTAALAIADHGFPVSLVEASEQLGGNLRKLHRTIEGQSPQELLEETVAKVSKHPLIDVYTGSKVVHSLGSVGRFLSTVEKSDGSLETIHHGVVILATGGTEAKTRSYGYGQSQAIMTQHELEDRLASGELDPKALSTVAMIQCVDSREEPRNYCSRVCCTSALKNALYLKEQNPETDIYILYRDLMSYGFLESYYTEARRAGVVFIQYRPDRKPQVSIQDGRPVLTVFDPVLGRELTIAPEALVLSTGIIPSGTEQMAQLFGVDLNQDGFFQEAEYKWRPVDFIKEGIFVAGIANSPRSIGESMAMAEAAAQRALRILNADRVASGTVVAEVRRALCSLCEQCIGMCPYGARVRDDEQGKVVVDELMCQGCGSCAAVCPNSASVLRGYRDQQVFEIIDSALESALSV